jgi:hypothetical protein
MGTCGLLFHNGKVSAKKGSTSVERVTLDFETFYKPLAI